MLGRTPQGQNFRHTSEIILAVFVGGYCLMAAFLYSDQYKVMLRRYASEATFLILFIAIALPIAAIVLQPRRPLSKLLQLFRSSGVRFIAVVVGVCAGLAAFTTFKVTIPAVNPFALDPLLADIDVLIHGTDPGVFLRATLPLGALDIIGPAYGMVWFLLWFGLLAFVAVHSDRHLRVRYFWCQAASFLALGTISATALSSVGPIFYDRFYGADRYAELWTMLGSHPNGNQIRFFADYLYSSYANGSLNFGTGISAMPSMHVAVAVTNALMLGCVNRFLGFLGWAYAILILVGSVYLGWHYALDGYFSIVFVVIAWWLLGRLHAPSETVRAVSRRMDGEALGRTSVG